jgi:epimerase transport system membrane fusion protein
VIGPGSPILHIIPEDEELIINAQVSPLYIDDIKVGAEAEVRFSAFSSKTTPVMFGRVQTVSADSLEDPHTGMRYYEAKIELTDENRQQLGDLQLIPGMPVDVLIKTGSRTLLKYLVQPLSDIFARSFTEK